MNNLELAKMQGNQAAPNLLEAALKGELGSEMPFFGPSLTSPVKSVINYLGPYNSDHYNKGLFAIDTAEYTTEEAVEAEINHRINVVKTSGLADKGIFCFYLIDDGQYAGEAFYFSAGAITNVINLCDAYIKSGWDSQDGGTLAALDGLRYVLTEELEPDVIYIESGSEEEQPIYTIVSTLFEMNEDFPNFLSWIVDTKLPKYNNFYEDEEPVDLEVLICLLDTNAKVLCGIDPQSETFKAIEPVIWIVS